MGKSKKTNFTNSKPSKINYCTIFVKVNPFFRAMIFSRQINNISLNSFITLVLILLFSFIYSPVKSQKNASAGLSTVIIDAGHGGKDPGAVVGRACEKDIVLDIALKLGNLIKKNLPDIKVVYTRSGDYFVPLFKRSVIANNHKADLFISIHANYCASPSIKGTETYILGLDRNQANREVVEKENNVVLLEEDYSKRYEGFDPKSTESNIAFELIQNNYIDQSLSFARMVQNIFRQHAGRSDRDVRQAGFLVLRETAMPSVLIETGYLSNKTEAEYLMTENGRETIALAIFRSVKDYKTKSDSRLNFAAISKNDNGNKTANSPNDSAKKDTQKISSQKKVKPTIKVNEKPELAVTDHKRKEEPFVKNEQDQSTKSDEKSGRGETPSAKQIKDQYTYAIQIAASNVKLSKTFSLFRGIKDIREVKIAGYFKYYCSESSSKSEAAKNLSILKKRIPDAFLVGMKNGLPVPIKEISVNRDRN
jgi:N-acetylmuramoyl-L-alanine amidase